MDAGVEHREQRVEDGGGHTGAADRHPAGPREQHGAHDVCREARTDADGARLHGALLVGRKIVRGNRLAGIGAERRVDAIDRRAGLREAVDDSARRDQAFPRHGRDLDRRVRAGNADDVADRDARAGKDDRGRRHAGLSQAQRTMPFAFRNARATSFGSSFSPSTL